MHISSILFSMNRQCNLVAAINGIFLHACNTSERVIDTVSRLDACISSSSIDNAVNSLSKETRQNLKSKGQTLLVGYALDNYDITFQHSTGTVEQQSSSMVHLTSGLIFNLQHTSLEDLMCSSTLWDRSIYNNKRRGSPPEYTIDKLFTLFPETLPPEELNYREDFYRWMFAVDLCTHGPAYFSKFLDQIRPPREVDRIPLFTTESTPLRSMKYQNSTVDGNISAIEESMRQTGVWDIEELMKELNQPGLDEAVILFCGDLGTWERIQSAQLQRSLEETSRERLQFLVFVPGLFHVKMACADAIWRIFIEPFNKGWDKTSMISFIEIFYPNLSTKIRNNKAGFHVLNDCTVRMGTADRLEALRVAVQEKLPDCETLDDFAGKYPKVDDIDILTTAMARQVGSSIEERENYSFGNKSNKRDEQYENTLTRIDLILLYEELAYSMRSGDVGRIETCLRRWIPIFKSIGKHKYATHLLQFMTDVHFMYPEGLKKAVRYNWLCNPTGKPMGFRGVDWMVELDNLYTKDVYGGSTSNYTVDRVIKESVLIQLYRDCKTVVEQQYSISPKTLRHGEPDLAQTYESMSRLARSTSLLRICGDRKSVHVIPNHFSEGVDKYNKERLRSENPITVIADTNFGEEISREDLNVEDEY